jgi:hypothetical protein
VVGRLELVGPPLTAPISGRRCAAYSATIQYHDRIARSRVAREAEAREFFVRDAAGQRVLVRAPVALMSGRRSSLRVGWWQQRIGRRLRRFLERHQLQAGPSLGGASWAERCEETVLLAADQVAIVGVASHEADPYRTASTRVTFAGAMVFRVSVALVALLGAGRARAQVSGTGAILGAPVSTAATTAGGSSTTTSVGIAPADGAMPEEAAWPPWPGAPGATFSTTVAGGAQAPSVSQTVSAGAAAAGTTAVLPPADPTAPLPPLTTTPSTTTSTSIVTSTGGVSAAGATTAPGTTTTTTLSTGPSATSSSALSVPIAAGSASGTLSPGGAGSPASTGSRATAVATPTGGP